jgi:hypothetical protein
MFRRRLAVIASGAAFALIGATAWQLFREDLGRSSDSLRTARAPVTDRDDSGAVPPLSSAQRVALDVGAPTEDAPASALDLEAAIAAAGITFTAGPSDGVAVSVVDRTTRAPRPDVAVFVFDDGRYTATTIWKRRLDPHWLRKRHVTALRSDADGVVRVAPPVRGALLVAEVGNVRGVLFVPPASNAPATLELGPPLELAVRVLDGGGAGHAGVAVGIAKRERSVGAKALAQAVTDDAGIATLRDLDLHLNGRAASGRWWVGLAFPTGTARGRTVELRDAPETPLEIELPPTGSLALQVAGPGGEPLPIEGKALLDVRRARAAAADPKPSTKVEPFDVAIGADGAGEVANLGLGLQFRVHAQLAGRQPVELDAVGPVHAGERVAIAIPAGAAGPIVAGRALDAAKAPLADADLVAELACRDGTTAADETKTSTRTDEEGRFTFDFSKADARARAGPDVLSISRRAHQAAEESVQIDLANGANAAAVDVGEVVLAELPLLCSGRVVDDRGSAVLGAIVSLTPRNDPTPAARSASDDSCKSRSDGRFELRGTPPADARDVVASARGYARAAATEFHDGAADLELVLPRAGAIVGSLALPKELPARLFHVSLRSCDGPDTASADPGASATVGAAGGFKWGDLAPGMWAVRIGLRDADDPSAARVDVTGIEVKSGETTQDERLTAVDVARLLRLLTVDVRDAQAGPVKSGTVAIVANGEVPRVESRLRDGRATLASPADEFELEVLAPGFKPKRMQARPGALAVVLERGIPIHIVAPFDHPRDASLVLGRIRLVPADAATAQHVPATSVRFDSSGEADAVVPLSGKYVARLQYRRRDATERTKGDPWRDSLSVPCEIADRAGPQVVTLSLPQ